MKINNLTILSEGLLKYKKVIFGNKNYLQNIAMKIYG